MDPKVWSGMTFDSELIVRCLAGTDQRWGWWLASHNTSLDPAGQRQEYMHVGEDKELVEKAAISLGPEHLASQAGARSACHGLHRRPNTWVGTW